MHKQTTFVLTLAILLTAIVSAALYTVKAANAQSNMTSAGGTNMTKNMTGAAGNMTKTKSMAVKQRYCILIGVLLAYTYFFAISVEQKIIITRLFFQNIKLNDGSYLESAMNNTDGQVDDPDLVLNSFETGLYDLLLSDIKMPEINGFRLYEELKDG